VQMMLSAYPERFILHEGTRALSFHSDSPLLIRCEKGTVECKRAVICTNGFRLPDLSDVSNSFPDDFLSCVTGYMNGYKPPQKGEKVGVFFHEVQPSADEPYIFSTTWGTGPDEILMVGGPQFACNGGVRRISDDERAHARIDQIASLIFGVKEKAVAYWDGPMGYTSSGVRLAGPDPKNPNLFYNLGCNGIGILHSVYGAHRIANLMAGRRTEDSVFDPVHQFSASD
jgi:glycine/D-amino acid oxidase-like deaminating enzyme